MRILITSLRNAGLPIAIDEVQLAGDRERGHVFTDRILHARVGVRNNVHGRRDRCPTVKGAMPDAKFVFRIGCHA